MLHALPVRSTTIHGKVFQLENRRGSAFSQWGLIRDRNRRASCLGNPAHSDKAGTEGMRQMLQKKQPTMQVQLTFSFHFS